MKTTYLFSATLWSLLALTACEKIEQPVIDIGEKVVLTVHLRGDAPAPLSADKERTAATYAAGTPVLATETAIKQGMIFVFRGSGGNPALDGKASFDFTSTPVSAVTVPITKGIRQVYVVANITPADFTGINNLSDLYTVANKLSLANFRTSGALAMSGFVNDVDLNVAANVTVPLNFIGARVHVDWDISNLNAGLVGNVTINGAAVLNAKTRSNYLATPLTASTYYSLTYGLNDFAQGYNANISSFTGILLPTGAGVTNSYDNLLNVAPADKGFGANYSYVFENNSSFPTIVALYGTYNGTTYFWPIVLNGALNGVGGVGTGDGTASIARGNIYNVKATIKGLGFTDPYVPISAGSLEVTITTAAWNPVVVINQEFN